MGSIDHRKHIKGKDNLTPDKRIYEACVDLRDYVEHQGNKSGLFAKDKDTVHTIKVDGIEIGYQVQECSPLVIDPYFTRRCWIKADQSLLTFKARELAAIKTAVLTAFFEPQQGGIKITPINPETLLLEQVFMIAMIQRGNERFSNIDMLHKGLLI